MVAPHPAGFLKNVHYCGELAYEHYQSESLVTSVHCPGHLTILTSHTGTAGCWPHCSSPRPSHKMFMAMWSIGQMSDEDNLETSRIGTKWREMNCHGILITVYSRIMCKPFMFSTNSSTLWSLCLWDFDSFNWRCSYHSWFLSLFLKIKSIKNNELREALYLMSEECDRARLWSAAEITQASIKYWWGPDQSKHPILLLSDKIWHTPQTHTN